jgi:2-oxoisovalerate dehydrogenase E2 component (dihydrolipoyl transacylase)
MSNIQQFRLPDAGEGLTEAEIVAWRVKPGDPVTLNQIVVEVETAKALTELPSPFAGVVTELFVPEGATVAVGTPIIAVDTAPTPSSPVIRHDRTTAADGVGAAGSPIPISAPTAVPEDPTTVQVAPPEGAVEPGLIGGPAPGGRTSVLVGYGPRTTAAVRRRRLPTVPPPSPVTAPLPTPVAQAPAAPVTPSVIMHDRAIPAGGPGTGAVHVLAKPPVRRLARDLGIDLATIPATGPGGIVTREDVEHAATDVRTTGAAPGEAVPTIPGPAPSGRSLPGTSLPGTGGETRIPIRGVRKLTAEAMVASAFTAPHVTEWLSVDVTRTMRLVDKLREDRDFVGVKVSPLLIVAKALLIAVRRNPRINASWDAAAGDIVIKHAVNLGIAAATPRGLVVPNIKDAGRLSLHELADALADLIATARDGRTPAAALTGGTVTITNVGVFGVDSGTPILNPGEAAILAFGQVRRMPWVHKGKVRPRWVTQLAVSFDHRLVDGDLGSRFLADVGAVLEDPARALVWG